MNMVVMSLAIVALMSAAVACGNNPKKVAEPAEEPAEEVCDSCKACCDSCAQEVVEAVEAVAE